MSKQKEILPKVIELISGSDYHCGIILGGSVSNDREHQDSDIDLQIIVQTGTRIDDYVCIKDGYIIQKELDGVLLDLCYWPVSVLEEGIESSNACKFYLLTQGKIIYDPKGIAAHWRARISDYFDKHQEIKASWERKATEYLDYKKDPNGIPEPLKWNFFANELARKIRGTQ